MVGMFHGLKHRTSHTEFSTPAWLLVCTGHFSHHTRDVAGGLCSIPLYALYWALTLLFW